MAAQFEFYPNTTDFQSTAEPLIFQVQENVIATYYKYRFILQVEIGGTEIAKLKTHPLTSSPPFSAVFDISRICDDYIDTEIENSQAPSSSPVTTLGGTTYGGANVIGLGVTRNAAREVTVKLGYESATSATAEPTETLNVENRTVLAFRDEFISDGLEYSPGTGQFQPSGINDNFLSSAPNLGVDSAFGAAFRQVYEHRIGSNEPYVLAWGADQATATFVIVRGFEADGTTIDTASLDISAVGGVDPGSVSTDAERVQYLGCGTQNLSEHAAEASDTNLANLIDSADLAYYELYLSASSGVSQTFQDSGVHRFTIDDGCSKYPRKQLLFLNRHGGWDCFNFDQRSEEKLTSIERSSYNRPRGNWDLVSATVDWDYQGYERGVTTTTVKAEKELRISTDYIDEGYGDHLRDIAVSRDVFLVNRYNVLIPVVVTDTEYLFKTTANEKLISYSFTLRYSNRPRLK
jgi:hypothetical protein